MRRPWLAALLLATAATPAAVILAVPAPRPLDAILAWPLVLMDRWAGAGSAGRGAGADERVLVRLGALVVGIVLTWAHYVLVARLLVWLAVRKDADRGGTAAGQNQDRRVT